jgi:hypothetical protein
VLLLVLLPPPARPQARTPPSSQWQARRQRWGQTARHQQSACHWQQQQQQGCRPLLRHLLLGCRLQQWVPQMLHLRLLLRLRLLWRRRRGCLTRQHHHLQPRQHEQAKTMLERLERLQAAAC